MITVVGLGFVGLTTALGFSQKNFKVYGYDVDQYKISSIKKCRIPFYEPHLDKACKTYLGNNFIIADSLQEAVSKSRIVFYCVGTPSGENGSADLTHLYKAVEETLKGLDKDNYKVLVIKSTIPPSTTQDKIKPFVEKLGFTVGKDIGLANNPEFLREGYAWDDFVHPDRIVIGVEDKKTIEILNHCYKPFAAPIHKVSLNTGEFIKYLSNTLFSSLISYSNEMSMVANSIGGIDIPKSFKILHEDKRWFGKPAKMTSYVYPGCGFGGYCLPKDTMAIRSISDTKGFSPKILQSVIETNSLIKNFVVDRLIREIKPNQAIGILGLSFKPDSDDVRETPAKDIIEKLLKKGYSNLYAYDPMAIEVFKKTYNIDIHYLNSLENIVQKADVFVLLTAWKEFKEKQDLLKQKPLYDFRYFL